MAVTCRGGNTPRRRGSGDNSTTYKCTCFPLVNARTTLLQAVKTRSLSTARILISSGWLLPGGSNTPSLRGRGDNSAIYKCTCFPLVKAQTLLLQAVKTRSLSTARILISSGWLLPGGSNTPSLRGRGGNSAIYKHTCFPLVNAWTTLLQAVKTRSLSTARILISSGWLLPGGSNTPSLRGRGDNSAIYKCTYFPLVKSTDNIVTGYKDKVSINC